jgi:hypothetical protein
LGFFLYNTNMAKDKENQKRLAKEWYERNKAIAIERATKWQKDNTERKREIRAKWRDANREQHNAYNREYFANNKDKRAFYQAKRKATILQRTPIWDPDAHLIVAKYQLAAMLTKASGIEYHVDHIIPLQGRKVSGLHVFFNLRVIPGSDNVKKSNSFQV